MKRTSQWDEVSPSYHGTTRDVPGAPLPAYLEPYIFPRYLTDEVREVSYLEDPELLASLAEKVLAGFSNYGDWQQTFDTVLSDVIEFPEVRRRVLSLLPEPVQQQIIW